VTSGTTHLVEHLALKTEWPPDEFNASVSEVFTHFWFSGEPARALERLAVTAAGLRALPVQHLPRERQILRTEASGRGVHQLSLHSSLRFGPVGPGLLYYDEYGLARVTRSDVRTWAARYFTDGNSVAYMTTPPPDGFALDMPPGARVAPTRHEPIPYVEYPSACAF
jgi:hypothetical protein